MFRMLAAVDPGTALAVFNNVTSTVAIVLLNKYLVQHNIFPFMVALSTFHFVFTTLATRLMMMYGVFEFKPAAFRAVLPLCIGSVGSVGFMNLNLAYNSVGFYQISKLVCIPVTLLLEYLLFRKTASTNVKLSLGVILLGVGIAQVSDVQLNFKGTMFAIVAVVATAMAQIYTNSKQAELGLNAIQLLMHSAPIISVGMAMLIPFFDDVWGPNGLLNTTVTPNGMVLVFLTCVLSVLVNQSNYSVIGRTSPITYQVVGHLKTCAILVLGFVVFANKVDLRNVFGIVVAVTGMIIYSEVKRQEGLAAKRATVNVSLQEKP